MKDQLLGIKSGLTAHEVTGKRASETNAVWIKHGAPQLRCHRKGGSAVKVSISGPLRNSVHVGGGLKIIAAESFMDKEGWRSKPEDINAGSPSMLQREGSLPATGSCGEGRRNNEAVEVRG